MAMDPEELVTLTDHGTMKLRSAVVRATRLPAKERKRAKIVREGEPAILIFKQIRNLGQSGTNGADRAQDSKDAFDLVGIGKQDEGEATLRTLVAIAATSTMESDLDDMRHFWRQSNGGAQSKATSKRFRSQKAMH